jgi:hypothetical protein
LCDNGIFCDGMEVCDAVLGCVFATEGPCAVDEWCDEIADACVQFGSGHFTGDDDVDLEDFAAFQNCFGEIEDPACYAGNMVGYEPVIDLADYGAFEQDFTGPQP